MYLVVSKWRYTQPNSDEFESRGRQVRDILKKQPGVQLLTGFRNENGEVVAVVGYQDQATYDRIINDPNGPFAKAVSDTDMENVAEWVSSERGEAIEDSYCDGTLCRQAVTA